MAYKKKDLLKAKKEINSKERYGIIERDIDALIKFYIERIKRDKIIKLSLKEGSNIKLATNSDLKKYGKKSGWKIEIHKGEPFNYLIIE